MSTPLRRTDLAQRGDRTRLRLQQTLQQLGDSVPGGAAAIWGHLSGTLDDQSDLKLRLDDNEALAYFVGT